MFERLKKSYFQANISVLWGRWSKGRRRRMKETKSVLVLLQILLYGAAWHQCALSARKTPTFRVLFWWPCLELKLFYFSIKSAAWLPVCQIETIGLSNRAPSNGVSIAILIYSTLYLCPFYLLLVNFTSSSGLPLLGIFVFIHSHLALQLFFLRQEQFIAMESEYQRKFVQKRIIIMY